AGSRLGAATAAQGHRRAHRSRTPQTRPRGGAVGSAPCAHTQGALPVLGDIPKPAVRLAVGIAAAEADVLQGMIAEGQEGLALAIDPVGLCQPAEELQDGAKARRCWRMACLPCALCCARHLNSPFLLRSDAKEAPLQSTEYHALLHNGNE